MISIKTKDDIKVLREGGKILANVLHEVATHVRPGVSTKELDQIAFDLIKKSGGTPAFLNYKPEGVSYPYPATLCVSVNEEVVHGIPSEDKILKEGDIVSLDCGLLYKGLFTDMAITTPVGPVSEEDLKLIEVTKKALAIGIREAKSGNTVGDIGHAIGEFIKKNNFTTNKILAGHGVGYKIHEDPFVPNFGRPGEGAVLKVGMVIAIEPMVNLGHGEVVVTADEYTFKTRDGKKSAHFEKTVAITEREPFVLTER